MDLHKAEGQEIVRRLAAICDVVVENFRPGRLEEWRLSYPQLSAVNPGLVMVRISGFGQTGPYSQRAGYGVIGEAVSGLRHVTGDPDRPPARAAVSLTDYITGLYGAFGAVMALLKRERTGCGQLIDAALYECAFSFMEPHIPAFDKLGFVANRAGSRLPDSTPNNLYETRDGRFVHITAMGDAVFRRLVSTMGQPGLADDPRFRDGIARSAHHEEIDEVILAWTRQHDLGEIESRLEKAQVPATRIYTMADIFGDAHYRARDMLVGVPDGDLGSITMAGVVPKLSATPGMVRHSGHEVGQDTRRVLGAWLELSDAELDRLAQGGVIYCGGPSPREVETLDERAGAA